jgi:glutathione S-transferase
MMEEHFYFLNVYERWMNDANFNKGPSQFFNMAPAPIRPVIRSVIRRKVAKMLKAQGLGRHTDGERLQLATGDLNAVETLLGDKPYILGERISEVDASVFPFVLSGGCSFFESRIGDTIRGRPRLLSYLARIRDAFFPEVVL